MATIPELVEEKRIMEAEEAKIKLQQEELERER